MSIAFLIVRVILGLSFIAHGSQKLFGWFGGYGIAGTGGFFEGLGYSAWAARSGLL
jgi:putative oxidoreductase